MFPGVDGRLRGFQHPTGHFQAIAKVHNSNVGHHGVERTLAKLHLLKQTWTHMREHIRSFIKQCPGCQKMSYLSVPIQALHFTITAPGPMESLRIDYFGPFVKCQHASVDISQGPSAYTQPNTRARCLIRHIGIFGCPSHIVTDRGVQFTSNIITEVMTLLGTDHVLTITASKEEYIAAEAANKRFQHFLRDMLFDRRIVSNWSDVLPLVQRIMMVEKNETIGMAPAQLLFGNLIHLDRGILLPNLPATRDDKEFMLSAWAARMVENQRVLLDIAQKRQLARDAGHMAASPDNPTTFPISTYVLVTQNSGILGAKPLPNSTLA